MSLVNKNEANDCRKHDRAFPRGYGYLYFEGGGVYSKIVGLKEPLSESEKYEIIAHVTKAQSKNIEFNTISTAPPYAFSSYSCI